MPKELLEIITSTIAIVWLLVGLILDFKSSRQKPSLQDPRDFWKKPHKKSPKPKKS